MGAARHLNRLSNSAEFVGEIDDADEQLFMLYSESNRMGSFDFQRSGTQYKPRVKDNTTLEERLASVERVENGIPLTPALD